MVNVQIEGFSRRIRTDLLRIYEGDVEAASEAIEQLCAEPEYLTAWATRMLRAEPMPSRGSRMPDTGPGCTPFSWDEVPESAKKAAVRGMAMAYLVANAPGQQREGAA